MKWEIASIFSQRQCVKTLCFETLCEVLSVILLSGVWSLKLISFQRKRTTDNSLTCNKHKRLSYILFCFRQVEITHIENYIISMQVEDYPEIYNYQHIFISAW